MFKVKEVNVGETCLWAENRTVSLMLKNKKDSYVSWLQDNEALQYANKP